MRRLHFSRSKWLPQIRSVALAGVGFDATRFLPDDGRQQAALQFAVHGGMRHIHLNAADISSVEGVAAVLRGMEENAVSPGPTSVHCRVGVEHVRGTPQWPECHRIHENVYHCMHSSYLEHAIIRCMSTLGRSKVDTVLLDLSFFGGETPLAALTQSAGFMDTLHTRIGAAFGYLEGRVDEGHVVQYGIATDAFVVWAPDGTPLGHVDLDRCLEAAEGVAGPGHHFRVVQLPLNFNESRYFLRPPPNQPSSTNFISYAQQRGLAVVAERPTWTVAMDTNATHSYIDVDDPLAPEETEQQFRTALEEALSLENRGRELFLGDADAPPVQWHSFAHYLARPNTPSRLASLPAFHRLVTEAVRPALRGLTERIRDKNRPELAEWMGTYRSHVEKLCRLYSDTLVLRSAKTNTTLNATIGDLCPDLTSSPLLCQKALRAVAHTGVDAVACSFASPREYKALVSLHPALQSPVDPAALRRLLGHPAVKHRPTV